MYTLQKYKNYYNLCLCSLSLQSVLAVCPCILSLHSVLVFCPDILSWQSVLAVFPGIPSWQICNLPVLRPVTEFRLGNKK